ncbi:MAG: sigma factor [bacterium]
MVSNGSHQAFTVLISRHQGAVRASLNHLTRDPSLAEDLAQETFIRAYRRISQYQIGRSFRAWIGGIAYYEFLKEKGKAAVPTKNWKNMRLL